MTRINLIPPSELCDQHLLSEFRELTRIPNCILKGRFSLKDQPLEYTLGTGHVKFFYDKLYFLSNRYFDLYFECLNRGFNVNYIFPDLRLFSNFHKKDYIPTKEAIELNRARIAERLESMKPRFTKKF